MASNRETIQAALFSRLSANVTGLITKTRFYTDFSKLSAAAMPAMQVVALSAAAQRQPAMPARWTQHAMVILWVRQGNDATVTPETALFGLIEQVETALQRQSNEGTPTDDYGTTLGGAVLYAHLVDMQIHHGVGEGQAAASLTIEMLSLS